MTQRGYINSVFMKQELDGYIECAFDGETYPESEMVLVDTKDGSEYVHEDNVEDFIVLNKYGEDYFNGK